MSADNLEPTPSDHPHLEVLGLEEVALQPGVVHPMPQQRLHGLCGGREGGDGGVLRRGATQASDRTTAAILPDIQQMPCPRFWRARHLNQGPMLPQMIRWHYCSARDPRPCPQCIPSPPVRHPPPPTQPHHQSSPLCQRTLHQLQAGPAPPPTSQQPGTSMTPWWGEPIVISVCMGGAPSPVQRSSRPRRSRPPWLKPTAT